MYRESILLDFSTEKVPKCPYKPITNRGPKSQLNRISNLLDKPVKNGEIITMTEKMTLELLPLNKTIINNPFNSIDMIEIYKLDTLATNPKQKLNP